MKNTQVLGWASARLDLMRSEEDLRFSLNGKWRGHLSRAERNKINIRHGCDEKIFAEFIQLYGQMLEEKKLKTNLDCNFFSTLYKLQSKDEKMEVFLAEDEREILGASLIAKYGSYSEYIATSTSFNGRRKHVGQMLLWGSLLEMKKRGFSFFDLSGVDPKQTPKGILVFKQGLKADSYRLVPELEAIGGSKVNRIVQWIIKKYKLKNK